MAKSADKIIVLHVPLLEHLEVRGHCDREDGYRYLHTSSASERDCACRHLDLLSYQRMLEQTLGRVDHLVEFYKTVGVNLFIDDLPQFTDESMRMTRYFFQKTAVECVIDTSSIYDPPEFSYNVRNEVDEESFLDHQGIHTARMNRIYSYNQNRSFLAERIHTGPFLPFTQVVRRDVLPLRSHQGAAAGAVHRRARRGR